MNGKLILVRALQDTLPAMPEKAGMKHHAWNQESADIWNWIYDGKTALPFDDPACRPETVFFSASYVSDVSVTALRDCGGSVCEVTHLATHPWQKGMNYGRCALLYAMEQVRGMGFQAMRIALDPEQGAAIHTVRELGFVPDEAGEYLLRVIPTGFEEETAFFTFTVGPAQEEEGGFVLYGQKDGQWSSVAYGSSSLEYSGCAIFALNHALQRLGYSGEEIAPAALARRYKGYLGINGTRNGALISRAAKENEMIIDAGFNMAKKLPKTRLSRILLPCAAAASQQMAHHLPAIRWTSLCFEPH